MRHVILVCGGVGLLTLDCAPPLEMTLKVTSPPRVQPAIIGGTVDTQDPAVLEIMLLHGGQMATCTGVLVGPRTVLTAGHCTDLAAGGLISGPRGPAMTVCTALADAQLVANAEFSSHCNLAILVLFNNLCATNDVNATCETNLVGAGDYILADAAVNPGYNSASHDNNNDVGLLHLMNANLRNGKAPPPWLTFNRADLGATCTNLGALRFVGYGRTNPNVDSFGVKYVANQTTQVADTWHLEQNGPGAATWGSVCGEGTHPTPTCMGDSGGPALDAQGTIVAITSEGDQNCSAYGRDTRTDAHAAWLDATMLGWGEPSNGAASSSGGPATVSSSSRSLSSSSSSSTSSSSSSGGAGGNECQSCQAGSCANGARCVQDTRGVAVCTGTPCTAHSCAPQDSCFQITDQQHAAVGNYCFPTTQTCEGYAAAASSAPGVDSLGGASGGGGSSSSTTSGWAASGSTVGSPSAVQSTQSSPGGGQDRQGCSHCGNANLGPVGPQAWGLLLLWRAQRLRRVRRPRKTAGCLRLG